MTTMDINDILTLQEVAEYLKIAPKTVQRMIGRNEIPCMKIAGQWRFRKHVIDAWLNNKMTFSEELTFADMMEVPGTIMQLSRLIQPDFMLMNMKASSVEQALIELAAPLAEHNFVETTAGLVTRLLARERMVTTAVGFSTAFPHVRNVRSNHPQWPPVIMGISREGVDFGCLDGSLTHVFYLLLASDETAHLRLLSRLSRFSRKEGTLKKILSAPAKEDISRLFMEDDYESMAQPV
jgi:PTS system nitrogen regulatory IIA component